jgi:4-oxalocrotonate tautomerase
MPLVRIDAVNTRSDAELRTISDGVHRALVETIGIPADDRFHVLSRRPAGELVYDPAYLGIRRTDGVVFVQITLSAGRSLEQKKALFARIVANLSEPAGVRPEDVFVNLVEIARENWSFGNGLAQYSL